MPDYDNLANPCPVTEDNCAQECPGWACAAAEDARSGHFFAQNNLEEAPLDAWWLDIKPVEEHIVRGTE